MKDKIWYEESERVDRSFWDSEKKIYLDTFPYNKGVFEKDDGNEVGL